MYVATVSVLELGLISATNISRIYFFVIGTSRFSQAK